MKSRTFARGESPSAQAKTEAKVVTVETADGNLRKDEEGGGGEAPEERRSSGTTAVCVYTCSIEKAYSKVDLRKLTRARASRRAAAGSRAAQA